MNKKIETKTGILIIGAAAAAFFLVLIGAIKLFSGQGPVVPGISPGSFSQEVSSINDTILTKDKITKFGSEAEFKDYLEKASQSIQSNYFGFGRGGAMIDMAMPTAVNSVSKSSIGGEGSSPAQAPLALSAQESNTAAPGRFSETNVQVLGIDEPDIIKTDGKQVYYSNEGNFLRPMPLMMRGEEPAMDVQSKIGIMPPDYPKYTGETKIITAYPPENLETVGKIDKNGELLVKDDILVVFSENKHKIFGYDISNPKESKEKWTVEIKENDELVGARLNNGIIYLATKAFIKPDRPCPIEPYIVGGSAIKLECNQIYHPSQNTPVDLTYNLLSFDLKTGKVLNKSSFVGSSNASVLYMSDKSIYLTYVYPGNYVKLFAEFLGLNSDIVPSSMVERIKKIQDYDLSDAAKMTELEDIVSHFTRSMSSDDMMRIQNELNNRVDKFYQMHGRELENTGIVKINIPDLEISAMGKVPGQPLNQFSLDEYGGNLRIATTSNSNFGWFGGLISGNNNNSVNDVYVLNNNLDPIGSVKDMGKGERIYSVRFIKENGYVVTFKQMDPFYVLNLSHPSNPKLAGELKIPGYSSYLHPIGGNIILGVGQEQGKVKLSLFDVTDPTNPKETANYKLDEYYSEVANNHHAFLQDAEHNIFFIPGSRGGYVFSYNDDTLKLEKAISESGVKRALYIGNYLYIVSDNKTIVLDENGWEKVNQLDF